MCFYCDNPDTYIIGVAPYNSNKTSQELGRVCSDHTEKGLIQATKNTFGTQMWPTVLDLNEKLLFHGYTDADSQGLTVALGWRVLNADRGV
jgi:hypothetical protein